MSMLAESRSKEKWSDDPRNTRWASDKSKFGYQMLTKMGWSEGSGLGQTLQGQTSHVKIKKKRNGYGIGVKTSHDDDWIAHQDSFNALLSQLNGNSKAGSESKIQSLEERVRVTKTKIMYSRFVKSKDLSRASSQDLASIFGQRSKSAPATPQRSEDENDSDSDVDSTVSCPTADDKKTTTKSHGFTTISSGVSVADYFAQKMAALQNKRNASSQALVETDVVKVSDNNTDLEDNVEDDKPKKKKKNKKQKVKFDIFEEDESEEQGEEEPSKTKTKKSKKKKKTDTEECDNDVTVTVECSESDSPPSVKKSKKKKKTSTTKCDNDDVTVIVDSSESDSPPPVKKSKKKKKTNTEECDNNDVTVIVDSSESDSPPPVKKSKKKKKKRKHDEANDNDDETVVNDGGEERKRKRKRRHQSDAEDESG